MRRILVALACFVLLAGAALPAQAAESPLRSAAAEIGRAFAGLWGLLSEVFTLGGDMDPNGLTGERGGTMDPNG